MMAKHYSIAFLVTLIFGCLLFIVSFFLPPTGKIDPSVLKGVAEMFLWPLLAFGAKCLEGRRSKE